METVTHYFLGRQNHLEKEMATYSSTLAWKITWMEEAGRLQSMRSQRAGHDWVTSLSKSLQMVTTTMKFKDACSLEEMLQPT